MPPRDRRRRREGRWGRDGPARPGGRPSRWRLPPGSVSSGTAVGLATPRAAERDIRTLLLSPMRGSACALPPVRFRYTSTELTLNDAY